MLTLFEKEGVNMSDYTIQVKDRWKNHYGYAHKMEDIESIEKGKRSLCPASLQFGVYSKTLMFWKEKWINIEKKRIEMVVNKGKYSDQIV
jgi:hypothetical protein